MRNLFASITLVLCSCSTQENFKVTAKGENFASFQATYRPFNSQGGNAVWGFAYSARDFSVDSAIAEGLQQKQSIERITLTNASINYSLSGYYTFVVSGKMTFGKYPSTGLIIYDDTQLLSEAKKRGRKNLVIKTIVSPIISGIDSAAYRDANMPIAKYDYITH